MHMFGLQRRHFFTKVLLDTRTATALVILFRKQIEFWYYTL